MSLSSDLDLPTDLDPLPDADQDLQSGSRLIAKVVSPAIRLWLRSQVEAVEALTFEIGGRDRQILKGHIPTVAVAAKQAVYQGLHLGQLDLQAEQIRINLGQVLKGRPLRLLNVVPVTGQVRVSQADLNASIAAPLLSQAVVEVLKLIWQDLDADSVLKSALPDLNQADLKPQIALQTDRFLLTADITSNNSTSALIDQRMGRLKLIAALQLVTPSVLRLTEIEVQYSPVKRSADADVSQAVSTESDLTRADLIFTNRTAANLTETVSPIEIDLGAEVALSQLTITPEAILCQGRINVTP